MVSRQMNETKVINSNESLIEKYKSYHGHLFNGKLSEEERVEFEQELSSLPDPTVLRKLFETAMGGVSNDNNNDKQHPIADNGSSVHNGKILTPVPEEMILECKRGSEEWKEMHAVGLAALKRGECAIVTLAGGQGTRLGSTAPKGCYQLKLPSGLSLFGMQAERIKKLQSLCGGACEISWYIMTSAPTHKATVEYFESMNFFGLSSDQVKFFQQGLLPAFDLSGRVLLSGRGKVSVAPDGNGGIYRALQTEGILSDMDRRGIKYVHMYCVDNCLVKVGDPSFLGACIDRGVECGVKSVEKVDPGESVGVFALNGASKLTVAEYSELSRAMSEAKTQQGYRLAFGEANIANHFFTLSFLARAANASLPYHVARKQIPTFDPQTGEIGKTSGVKLEAFIFDVFDLATTQPLIFRVPRTEEFAPLKNASGAACDSPERCVEMLFALHVKYLQEAGALIGGGENGANGDKGENEENGENRENGNCCIEISPALSYEGEGLEAFKGKQLSSSSAQFLQ